MSNNFIDISLSRDRKVLRFEGASIDEEMTALFKSFFDVAALYADALSSRKSMDADEFGYIFGDIISLVEDFQREVNYISSSAAPHS